MTLDEVCAARCRTHLPRRWRDMRAWNDNACGASKGQNFHESLLDLTCLSAAPDPQAPMYCYFMSRQRLIFVGPGRWYCKTCPPFPLGGGRVRAQTRPANPHGSIATGSARAHTERRGRSRSALRAPATPARRAPARARSRGPHTPRPSPQPWSPRRCGRRRLRR